MEPRFEEHRAFTVIGLEYSGDNANDEIMELWNRLMPLVSGIAARTGDPSVYYGVCDSMNDRGEMHYVAGIEAENDPLPTGMVRLSVPAGRYAVFTHRGSLAGLTDTYQWIFSQWLPMSGHQLRNTPVFERYDERFQDFAPESELDIYIPVA